MTLILGTEAVDVLRRKQWRAGRRTMLLESADTNLCPRSEDLSQWTNPTGGTGVRTGSQTDPKGGSTAFLLDDQDALVGVYWKSPSFIAYSGAHTQRGFSWFIKAGTAAISDVDVWDDTAVVQRLRFRHTWTAGVPSVAVSIGSGTVLAVIPVTDAPGWYRVLVEGAGLVVANTHTFRAYPAGGTAVNVGSAAFWGFHAHSTCTPARQYHGPTGAGSTNSGSDLLHIPYAVAPGAITLYARYYEQGAQKRSVLEAQSQRIIELSGVSAATPRLILFHLQPNSDVFMWHVASAATKESKTAGFPTLNYGDKVEAMGLVYPDGSVQVIASVNNAAPIVGPRSTAVAFDPAWSVDGLLTSQRIKPFATIGGTGEVERILVTPGIYTLDEARSLAG